ncbi:MAG TPA: membrane dipeptidase [Actinomycetota bacterium]|nr:membrane dipeptidase [Actinomycetota bacterium]
MEHASRLHEQCLVIDTCGPLGPSIYTQEMLDRIDEMSAAGAYTGLIISEIESMQRAAIPATGPPGFWTGLAASGVDISVVTIGAFGPAPFSFEGAIADLAGYTRLFDSTDRIRKVTSAAEARAAKDDGVFGVILDFQNSTHARNLDDLDLFYDFGLRVIQLTYNERNLVADGCTERNPSGLSNYGVSFVKRMNELGILVDTSHSSERTTLDALDVSERPTAVTHSFAKALHNHDRGKGDDVIKAVGESGGYFGVLNVPFFITAEPEGTMNHFIAHFERIVELAGPEHVGIGTDWGQVVPKTLIDLLHEEVRRFGFRPEHRVDFGAQTRGFETWEKWPNITAALVERGYSDNEIKGFLGTNFLRVFERATEGA